MTQKRKAQVVTLIVIAAGLVLVIGRETGWRLPEGATLSSSESPSDDPVDAINRMTDAAREGDVDAYLSCFGGQMEKTLRQSVTEMTPDGFARYLMANDKLIKGIAMYKPEVVSESAVDVRIEYVYVDRNEAQRVRVEKLSGAWVITKVDGVERVETIVPYGTPVY
ncbi:MAG: hypothetical protein O2968_02190 [Acidobacteria bacterium]|nr:hypothetical protein [Acidobacteriota bacterium]